MVPCSGYIEVLYKTLERWTTGILGVSEIRVYVRMSGEALALPPLIESEDSDIKNDDYRRQPLRIAFNEALVVESTVGCQKFATLMSHFFYRVC